MRVEKLRAIVGRIDHQMLKPKSGKRGEGEIGTLLEISTTDYDFMSNILLTLADVLEVVGVFKGCRVSNKEEMQKTEDDLYKAYTVAHAKIEELM